MKSIRILHESRQASILLGVAVILSIVPLIFDPVTGGPGPKEYLKSFAAVHNMKAFVFGTSIVSFVISIVGFISFAIMLGLQRILVQTGLTLFLLGCFSSMVASFIDGFVAVSISTAFADAPIEEAKLAFNSFILLAIAITSVANFSWLVQALATLAFSLCLIRKGGQFTTVAIIGFFVGGIALVALLLKGGNPLLAIRTIIGVEGIWTIAVATLLWRNAYCEPQKG
jgi:hypothetical protein